MLWNRNKRSVALDLKSEDDLRILQQMARKADVMIENFRPGTAEGLVLIIKPLHKLTPT